MCDEYDDERMRVLWRQLAMRDELAKLEPEPDGTEEILVKPIGELEPKREKRQPLVR